MNEKDRPQVIELLKELEQHFGAELPQTLAKGFIKYALDNFATFPDFEKAAELVAIHEVNFGRFPSWARFRELFVEHKRSAAYQPPELALPPSPEERSEPATSADIERLKAKVRCSQYFSKSEWGVRYLREAIVEAEARSIPLQAIGVVEAEAVAEQIDPVGTLYPVGAVVV